MLERGREPISESKRGMHICIEQ